MSSPLARSASLVVCLVVFAACSQTLTGPVTVPPSANPQEFIWSSHGLELGEAYTLVRTGAGADHLLSSSDGIHVHDAALNATAFMLHSTADSVVIDSMGVNSIFSLPAGYSFVGKIETLPKYFGVNHLLTLSTGRVIAATDQGIYYSDDNKNWFKTFNGVVRSLVQDRSDSVYAAIGDSVIGSKLGAVPWVLLAQPHKGVPITSIAWAPSGTLFIGFAYGFGVERSKSLKFDSYMSANIPATSVTALAAQGDTLGDEEIVVCDSGGILSYTKMASNTAGPAKGRCVFLDSLGTAYAGVDGYGLLKRTSFTTNWNTVPGTVGDTIVGLIGHGRDGVFAATSSGTLLSITSGSFDSLIRTHSGTRSLCADRKGRVLMGSDDGIVSVAGSPSQASGPFGPNTLITVQTPGGLTILQKQGMSAAGSVGQYKQTASWPGGIIVGPGFDSGISITARIMDHVDSLAVPFDSAKTNRYGESYIIRYSHESSDGSIAPNFPLYWLCYYSRGVGPVLIEEYMLGSNKEYSPIMRATRKK